MSSLAGGQPWPSGAVQSAKAVLHRTSKEGCWPPDVSDSHPLMAQEQGKRLVWRSGGEVRSCSHPAEARGKLHDYRKAETFRAVWCKLVLSLLQLWSAAALLQGHLSLKSFHFTLSVSNFEASATGNGKKSSKCSYSTLFFRNFSQTLTN